MSDYEQNLEANLQDLCTRVHTGRYRPQPVRRVYIPKADGGRRPLGVPTLEDKIVQGAVAELLDHNHRNLSVGLQVVLRRAEMTALTVCDLH